MGRGVRVAADQFYLAHRSTVTLSRSTFLTTLVQKVHFFAQLSLLSSSFSDFCLGLNISKKDACWEVTAGKLQPSVLSLRDYQGSRDQNTFFLLH